jgi:hypothetical protein
MPALLPDVLLAILVLGLPVALASWFIFHWLFSAAGLEREGDRKTLSARVKKARKRIAKQKPSNGRYVYEKWMLFGSGFYGLAGLWTFVLIEVQQAVEFVLNFPGWNVLLQGGVIGFLINFLINQLANVLQGLIWFSWWPADSMLIWIGVAYLGYWAGVELARRQITFFQSRQR